MSTLERVTAKGDAGRILRENDGTLTMKNLPAIVKGTGGDFSHLRSVHTGCKRRFGTNFVCKSFDVSWMLPTPFARCSAGVNGA